ncbi:MULTISPECIES: STAS domain-containing protein [unclassified Streptomyces]|uniref:STAS domain-containing protein n=1 Tax=unclassified Streptomyces TaxID=2593676 RepID=UPI0035DA505C
MNITTTITGTSARITPHGEIDLDTLPPLRAAVDRLPPHVTGLVWDLEHLSFTDIAGLRLLFGPAPQGSVCRRTSVTSLREQPLQLLLIAADLFPTVYDVAQLIPDTPAALTARRP